MSNNVSLSKTTPAQIELKAKAQWKYATEWAEFQDLIFRQKKVGSYTIELYAGTQRGGCILIWEPIETAVLGDRPAYQSKDGKLGQAEEIHFAHYGNAQDEYQALKTVRATLDLMWRNC